MRYLSFTRHLRSWQAFCISALWIVSLRPLQPQIHGGLFSHTANLIRVSTSFSVPSYSTNALFMQCLRTRRSPVACALLNNIKGEEQADVSCRRLASTGLQTRSCSREISPKSNLLTLWLNQGITRLITGRFRPCIAKPSVTNLSILFR